MLVAFYLLYFKNAASIESGIGNQIKNVDLCACISAFSVAMIVYFSTNPENNNCLEPGNKNYKNGLLISRVIFISVVAFQLLINGGLKRTISRSVNRICMWSTALVYYCCYWYRPDESFVRNGQPTTLEVTAPLENKRFVHSTVNRLFDRWALVLILDVILWTQSEYEDFTGVRQAAIGSLAVYFRIVTLLRFIEDCSKLFCGQFDGIVIPDHHFHSGVVQFRELWSRMWIYELFIVVSFVIYYAVLLNEYLTGNAKEIPSSLTNYSSLLMFSINTLLLIALVNMLNITKTFETEIRAFSSHFKGSRESDSNAFLQTSRLFDVIKMLMFVQFMAVVLDVEPIVVWAFPSYEPNQLALTLFYILGSATPLLYEVMGLRWAHVHCGRWFNRDKVNYVELKEVVKTVNARKHTVIFIFSLAYICCNFIGAYRGCSRLHEWKKDDMDPDHTLNDSASYLVYLAKTFAYPTSFGFGMLFLTSPGAAQYSSTWSTLAFPLKILLSFMPWMTPQLMSELHIISGTIFFVCGMYHALCWVFVYAVKYATVVDTSKLISIVTGGLMILISVKLIWPPGMRGLSALYNLPQDTCSSCYGRWHQFDAYLRDSKYGSAHVYLANFVICCYIVHATYSLEHMYYWTFPVLCWVALFVLHPSKGTYIASKFQWLRSKDGFNRKYEILSVDAKRLRSSKMMEVTIKILLPTFEQHFARAFEQREGDSCNYNGYCDVILIRLRPKPHVNLCEQALQGLETVHYYSVSSITKDRSHRPTINAKLLVQQTGRREGCSASIVHPNNADGSLIEIVGFVKSNALDCLHTPSVIAFGWESGAAAFSSLFKQRQRQIELRREVAEKMVVKVKKTLESTSNDVEKMHCAIDQALLIPREAASSTDSLNNHQLSVSMSMSTSVFTAGDLESNHNYGGDGGGAVGVAGTASTLQRALLDASSSSTTESPFSTTTSTGGIIGGESSSGRIDNGGGGGGGCSPLHITDRDMSLSVKNNRFSRRETVSSCDVSTRFAFPLKAKLVEPADEELTSHKDRLRKEQEKDQKEVQTAVALLNRCNDALRFPKDLMVIWAQFMEPRYTQKPTAEQIFVAIKELANFQRYMLEQAGNKAKIIFIVTGVPLWWTIESERTFQPEGIKKELLLKPVRQLVTKYVLKKRALLKKKEEAEVNEARNSISSINRTSSVGGGPVPPLIPSTCLNKTPAADPSLSTVQQQVKEAKCVDADDGSTGTLTAGARAAVNNNSACVAGDEGDDVDDDDHDEEDTKETEELHINTSKSNLFAQKSTASGILDHKPVNTESLVSYNNNVFAASWKDDQDEDSLMPILVDLSSISAADLLAVRNAELNAKLVSGNRAGGDESRSGTSTPSAHTTYTAATGGGVPVSLQSVVSSGANKQAAASSSASPAAAAAASSGGGGGGGGGAGGFFASALSLFSSGGNDVSAASSVGGTSRQRRSFRSTRGSGSTPNTEDAFDEDDAYSDVSFSEAASQREFKRATDSLNRFRNSESMEADIVNMHCNPDSWISMSFAFNNTAHYEQSLQKRIAAAIVNIHRGEDALNYYTFFVTEHRGGEAQFRNLRYETFYDTVNKVMIESQLRYIKSPEEAAQNGCVEPYKAEAIAADVVYSGDYKEIKADLLRRVVDGIAQKQWTDRAVRKPAALNFVSDA